jgi:hypothetical protein
MATYVFNIAKGRVVELCTRVKTNDPATSILSVHALSATPSQATAQDVDTYAALITAGAVELNANGWSVATLTDTDLAALAPDDTNDRFDASVPAFNLGTPTTGSSVAAVVCYASVAAPTNSQRIPLTHHDFPATANGLQVKVNTGAFFRAP